MERQRLALVNGLVYTVDARRSVAQALMVCNGRIAAVGSSDEVLADADRQTLVVDLGGRLVLPGFIDAHMHPAQGAASELFEPSLRGCTSAAECLKRIETFLAADSAAPFVTAWGWSAGLLDEDELTAARLDAVVADRPVALYDDGGHAMWVNSRTLELAGISALTPDPSGGVIERTAGGIPSGLLREEPIMWVERALPKRTVQQYARALSHFQREIAGPLGLTTVQEAVVRPGDPLLDAYEELQMRGELSVRACVSLWIEHDPGLDEQVEALVAERSRHRGPLVRAGCAKLFADGVVEGHTAYLKHDYADRPGYRGEPSWSPEGLTAASIAAARAGFQLHYHAIGDAGVALSLDAIRAARRAASAPPRRSLVTHLQLVDPADLRRFSDLDVVALPQPYWFVKDELFRTVLGPYLGRERAEHQYPMRSYWDHRVVVASASDYPVVPRPDPLLAIQRGVLRREINGAEQGEVLWPEERVGVEQMIETFTINGAFANFLEDETGSLEVGKAADLVVLSENILEQPPQHLSDASVLLTLFSGRPVHALEPFSELQGPEYQ